MAHHGMPFLIINYGAEMIFILEQRLHAQNVSQEKSYKVLQDVAKSMFAPQLVQELMRPQDLYTPAATREVFDRLAQSSIMRLSENSMDKLYDLMTMGCKYQLFSCKSPKELVELTMNHLEAVKRAIGPSGADIITNCEEQFLKTFANFTSGEFAEVRHQLLSFFQGKRVKVSLFLQEKLQNPDATFNIERGGPVTTDPPVQPIGTIKYFENGACALTEQFAHPDAAIVTPAVADNSTPFNAATRTSKLGVNLYMTERKKPAAAAAAAPAAAAAAPAPAPSAAPSTGSGSPSRKQSSFRRHSANLTGNAAALNSLSAMIVGSTVPKETVRINLFDEPAGSEGASSSGADAGAGAEVINISRVSRDDIVQSNSELVGVISGFDSQQQQQAATQDGGQDLLDLMDGQ